MILLTERVSQSYNKPVNYREEDAFLFKDEAERVLPQSGLLVFKNIGVNENGELIRWFYFLDHNLTESTKHKAHTRTGIRRFLNGVKNYKYSGKKANYVLLIDSWSGNYFHFIFDVLPKLFFSEQHIRNLVIVLPDYFPPSYIEFLKQLGFDRFHFIKHNEILFIDKVFVPDLIFNPSGVFANATILSFRQWLLSKVKINGGLPSFDKIFISRKNAQSRRIVNEAEIIDLMRSFGYHICYTEDLSVVEQVSLFAHARFLISIHGAGLTNMLFMPLNSTVVEFRLRVEDPNNTYFRLASVLNHKYYYVNGEGEKPDFQFTDLIIDKENVRKILEEISHE